MELTGKCKEEFEGWLSPNVLNHNFFDSFIAGFFESPQSMQYGVYVDYFESVDIILDTQPIQKYNNVSYTAILGFIVNVNVLNVEVNLNKEIIETKSRSEARIKSIEEACKIRNEQLNK